MATIRHRVGIVAPEHEVWTALTEPKRLAGWWSSSADGSSERGGTLNLEFEGLTTLSFHVIHRSEDRLLHLMNIDGPGAWKTSDLEFHLERGESHCAITRLSATIETACAAARSGSVITEPSIPRDCNVPSGLYTRSAKASRT